ncbi:hypothetical protein [Ideonella sp. A 288]|uniref:hypothetical protein n=1 Tax=Ideonella sp. A 288 TaxID=1962181 RepID=UPI0011867C15|nr:hypothetical protein [Ideonella sp. A 288]
MTRLSLAAAACAVVLTLGAPAHAQPVAGSGAAVPGLQEPGRFAFLRYAAPVPRSWQSLQPSSSFRAAQYRVPGEGGGSDGEAVVFYFGKGQGGPVAANIDRWVSQFLPVDGRPVQPKTESLNVKGIPVTVVELNGSYARGVGMGPIGAAKPNQTMLAAVIETPDGNLTVQLHGDQATIAQHRAGFTAMVKGFEVR